jgi:CARDB protein
VRLLRLPPGYELRRPRPLLAWLLVAWIGIVVGPVVADAGSCANSGLPGTPYEGFGAGTTGGAGKPIYRVTTLADSGSGSLREALSAGNRCIVFDVAGNIVLRKQIYVGGGFVTVDGFSARAPGITLRDFGISIWGSNGAHDVILRGLRFRNVGQKTCDDGQCWDGIQIKNGAYRIVIDHVSNDHASDGAIDITSQAGTLTRDVTIQWSILSGTRNQAAVGRAARVSMHHNLFIGGQNRNPQADWDTTLATRPPDTVLDFRNNVVWNFSGYGTLVRRNATANVVNNYYYSPSRPTAAYALIVDHQGRAHAAGNHSGNGADVDERGTERAAFAAAGVSVTDACRAAYEVQDEAGARGVNFGPDSIDSRHLEELPSKMPGCGGATSTAGSPATPPPTTAKSPDLVVSSLAMPVTLQRGQEFHIRFGITNRGTGTAAGSRVAIYLSTDTARSASDVLLRSRSVSSLSAGASQSHALSEVIPSGVKPGSYYVVLVVDQDGAVRESNDRNNVTVARVTVR